MASSPLVRERPVVVIPAPKTVVGVRSVSSLARLAALQTPTSRGRPASTAVGGTSAFLAKPFLWAIRLYQKTLSFDHGPLSLFFPYGYCRYEPSCSQYTYDAIRKRGIFSGLVLGAWRVLRCNPFSHGGIDPAPDEGFRRPSEAKKKK